MAGIGNDIVRGGLGRDVMTGGSGRDVFDFNLYQDIGSSAPDIITDFRHGEDRIDLAGIDANINMGGNQAFVYIASKSVFRACRRADGEALWQRRHSTTRIYGDLNGDTYADMQIRLVGHINLAKGDFIL